MITKERVTRASHWRSIHGIGLLTTWPARIHQMEVGPLGELVITLRMDGDELLLRFSPKDTLRILREISHLADSGSEGPKSGTVEKP